MYIGRTGPGRGIGYGIGTQAMAGSDIGGGPRGGLGSCCSACARGERNCGAMSGLGAVSRATAGQIVMSSSIASPSTSSVTGQPAAGGGGGLPTIAKLVLLAGVVGGGVFLYRKFKKH